MEQRYLNKKVLDEIAFYVKARDYYKDRLKKLNDIKKEVTDQVTSITINISYKTKGDYSDYSSKAIEIHQPYIGSSANFDVIPASIIAELENKLIFNIAFLESYLWDRFGYTDDAAAMKEVELQDRIYQFMLEKGMQIEISPNAIRNFLSAGTPIRKIIEATLNKRTDGNDNGGGKQDEQV